MAIGIEISDREYDYTDEEKAAGAIADFQVEASLDDDVVLAMWNNDRDPRRPELEARIFAAVDANGTSRRARETVPGGISLFVEPASSAA